MFQGLLIWQCHARGLVGYGGEDTDGAISSSEGTLK